MLISQIKTFQTQILKVVFIGIKPLKVKCFGLQNLLVQISKEQILKVQNLEMQSFEKQIFKVQSLKMEILKM